jgi:hypothetical protein
MDREPRHRRAPDLRRQISTTPPSGLGGAVVPHKPRGCGQNWYRPRGRSQKNPLLPLLGSLTSPPDQITSSCRRLRRKFQPHSRRRRKGARQGELGRDLLTDSACKRAGRENSTSPTIRQRIAGDAGRRGGPPLGGQNFTAASNSQSPRPCWRILYFRFPVS